MLHDHGGDGAVGGAYEFEDGDFTNLAHRQGVDDEGHNGRADDGQNDQKHGDLLGRCGNELLDQNALHLCAGIDTQVFPTPDRFGHGFRVGTGLNLHQYGIDRRVGALRSNHGLQKSRHTRTIECGALRGACALGHDGVVVF